MDRIEAQPGPQSRFLSTSADIAIYGGGAGGGKSFGLLLQPLYHIDNPLFGGVIFRRTSPQLTGAGSLWEDAQGLYRPLPGTRLTNSPSLEVRFRSGAMLQFLHLQHESDIYDHQGKQYAFIGFDELTHFTEAQFWYLVSRLRSTSGVRPFMRCTTNPDPDSFVRSLVAWWIGSDGLPIPARSGVLRWFVRDGDALIWFDSQPEDRRAMSLTFIGAKLTDNPALLAKDPDYAVRLASLPEIERARLGGGNWDIRHDGGRYIEAGFLERRWVTLPDALNIYICSDYAVSEPRPGHEPDFTEHGVFGIDPLDDIYVLDWWHGQEKSDVWIDALLDKVARHKPLTVFGEAGVIQKAIEPALNKRMQERRIYARTQWLSASTRGDGTGKGVGFDDPSKRAKAIRGRSFQARASLRKVLFPANAEWADRVIRQCVGFPVGKDDAFDVMSHMCLALDEAHAATAKPGQKPRKPTDYGQNDRPSGGGWKTV